jgi:peroxidase
MSEILINNDIYQSGSPTNFYSINGGGNNQTNRDYGASGSIFRNTAPLDFGDGISSPAGSDRPNPRIISNTLAQQDANIQSDRGLTNLIWVFGQFLDHDITLTSENRALRVDIPVPTGDLFLDPNSTGTVNISLNATAFVDGTGTSTDNPAQIRNTISAWVDGSNIYSSNPTVAANLRAGIDGLFNVSEGNLLPFAPPNPNRPDVDSFSSGDSRVNENSALVAMHTLFMREHNRIAGELKIAHPTWTDEQLYQRARQINIAQYQAVVYREYLPSLLGIDALPEYSGYDATVNPNLENSFSSASFRVGHTQLGSQILRLDTEGQEIPEGSLTLSDVFFRSAEIIQETGIDPILRGIASSLSEKVDVKIIDDIRNLLFSFAGTNVARDLFAINIQRGRLNGISDYNTVREAFGLDRVTSFADITSDVELQNQLEELYITVDNIDLYVALLAEDHVPGAAVGETFQALVAMQFAALRDGDRFYYENIFTPEEVTEIENATLSEIIRRNTDTTIIQDKAFSLLNEGTASSEQLNGGLGNDSIFGGDGDDTLIGFQGDDLLSGGTGNDTYIVDAITDVITENANEGSDLISSSVTYTLGTNLENLTLTGTSAINGTGNTLNNTITGNTANNILSGGTGNDTIAGGIGNDTMIGGAGNDTYNVDAIADAITENANEGSDSVNSKVTYTLVTNLENLTLTGTSTINGTGNTLNNTIKGNAANNILSGGLGSDTMTGGAGNDTYNVDATADVITENANEGSDFVNSKVTYTLAANLENLTLTGTSAINGTGNTLNNIIKGNAANNILSGGTGKDTMIGGAGNDVYQLNANSLGSEIQDSAGSDSLLLTNLEITLSNPQAATIGLAKVGNDLIVDLNRDGVANADNDVKVTNFFNTEGKAGTGFVETINNLSGAQIVDYFTPEPVLQLAKVHRFYQYQKGCHLYTSDQTEIEDIQAKSQTGELAYNDEAEKFNILTSDKDALTGASIAGVEEVYRFFNSQTGAHLYTMDEVEKEYIEDNLSNYTNEGIKFYAFEEAPENIETVPVFRMLNSQSGSHLFTTDQTEIDYIQENLPNFSPEGNNGVAYYVVEL